MGKTKSKKRLIPLLILLILVVGGIIAVMSYNSATKPVDNGNEDKYSIVIPEGASTDKIAALLGEKNLINSELVFKIKSKLDGNDGSYKIGTYSLSPSMSMNKIMTILITGQSTVQRFTIPEGYTVKQTMKKLVKEGLVTEDDFMDEVANGDFDYKFLADVPAGENRLEGYLYPDTYEVYKNATAHDIIDKMLGQFDSLFTGEYYEKAEKMDMTVQEIVTLASVIERESKSADERPIMAGVFYNRLKKNMKLQSCATVQYILDEPKEHLTNDDIATESPYNTYLHEGLPPGPVCSPRIASVEAALYPDDNDYIYFVLKPALDGTHNFSADYAKFEQDKAAYKQAVANQ